MRHWRIWLYLIGMVGILGLCVYVGLPAGREMTSAPVQQEAVSQATEPAEPATAVAQVDAASTAEATVTEAPSEAPTEAPTETAVAVAEQVDYCVECHTDKEQLIDTAAPEEEVVEESEGAG